MASARFLFLPARDLGGASSGEGAVGWRLVAGNNYELGRSALAYPELQVARDAAASLAAGSAADLGGTVEQVGQQRRWVWSLPVRGEVVARSSRWHSHRRECRDNLRQFLLALPDAAVTEVFVARPRPRPESLTPRQRQPVEGLPAYRGADGPVPR